MLLSSWLCLILHASLAHSVAIDNYFQIAPGNSEDGGCDGVWNGKTGKDWINQWWNEAQTLSQTGVDASTNYGSDVAIRANFLRFFGVTADEAGNAQNNDPDIANHFNTMNGFFSSPPPAKGWIFCSAGWLKQEQKTDIAKDSTDQPNEGKLTIQQLYPDDLKGRALPFWAPALNKYYFGFKKVMSDYCANQNKNFGGTLDWRDVPPGTMTLCMTRIFAASGVASLGQTQPTAGQSLESLMSWGVTFYHELWHWVLSSASTPDDYSDLTGVLKVAVDWAKGKTSIHPADLPENLATFAEAQWLTQNTNPTFVWDGKGNAVQQP